jgi:hypothetical protein
MYHDRPSHTTPVLALLCAACLLPLLPAVAQAQSATRTDYWINDTDSSLAEIVVDDTVSSTAPDSGGWSSITLVGIHALGRYSPSEDEAVAIMQGHHEEYTQLGTNTRQTAWFIPTQGQGTRSIRSGSGSQRIIGRCWPGYVRSDTHLKKGNEERRYAARSFDPCYTINISTCPETWDYVYPYTTYHWYNDTYHDYGNGNFYGTPDIDMWW